MAKKKPKRLIIASNREPYGLKKGELTKTVGGVVSALDPIMQGAGGVWVASGGAQHSGPERIAVPPTDPKYAMRLVPLNQKLVDGYYNGYANRFLWPLCHIALDRVYMRKHYWHSYRRVNEMFAEAIAEEVGDGSATGSVVWLQDYHLALCAKYIRGLVSGRQPASGLKLAIFWHIPWPPYDVFKACPQRKEVLEGMLANDLIGFQLDSFRINFLRCAARELGAPIDLAKGTVRHYGHTTRVKAFPISVDYDWFDTAARDPRGMRFLKRFIGDRGLGRVKIGLAVDRLDYTKGIVKSLEAVELLFKKYPRFREKFTFVQVAVPTRKVEPFLSYMEQVRKKVEGVNAKYSTGDWRPVEYIERGFDHNQLAALYRRADLALISSIYDGMNLVAKEYIASQVDLSGVLLVSEFAGSAEEVPGAFPINPYDTEGCADAMKQALEMAPHKKKDAMERARWYVKEKDIYRWVDEILSEIGRLKGGGR